MDAGNSAVAMIARNSPVPQARRRLDEGPALDRTRLVGALMKIARSEGVAAINMRRVAKELGVSARLLSLPPRRRQGRHGRTSGR